MLTVKAEWELESPAPYLRAPFTEKFWKQQENSGGRESAKASEENFKNQREHRKEKESQQSEQGEQPQSEYNGKIRSNIQQRNKTGQRKIQEGELAIATLYQQNKEKIQGHHHIFHPGFGKHVQA